MTTNTNTNTANETSALSNRENLLLGGMVASVSASFGWAFMSALKSDPWPLLNVVSVGTCAFVLGLHASQPSTQPQSTQSNTTPLHAALITQEESHIDNSSIVSTL